MKAIIENSLFISAGENHAELSIELTNVIFDICNSENEIELRNALKARDNATYNGINNFTYGFGSSHMWLNQKGRKERILIVEF